MNLFKRFTKPTRYDTDYFIAEAFQRHRTEIDALLAFVQPYDRTLVEDFLRRLLIHAYDLPGDWGIFKLTLRLATHAVAQNQNADLRHKDHATLVIAAGLWAARSVPLYVVKLSDLVTDTEHAWSRGDAAFLHWLMDQGDGGRFPRYSVTVTPAPVWPAEIAAQAAWFLHIPAERTLGYENVLRLWEFALAAEPRTKMHAALGVSKQDELGHKFLKAISAALDDEHSALKVNTFPGHVFVLDNETFMTHPSAIITVMEGKYSPDGGPDSVLSSLMNEGIVEGLEQAVIYPGGGRGPVRLTGFFIDDDTCDYSKHGTYEGHVERVQ